MQAGRKRRRILFTPFAPREPEQTFSTGVVRFSRCNQCGAIRVWPYTEHVLEGDQIIQTIEHPGHPATHHPDRPLAHTQQL